jgi:hypothetical protein
MLQHSSANRTITTNVRHQEKFFSFFAESSDPKFSFTAYPSPIFTCQSDDLKSAACVFQILHKITASTKTFAASIRTNLLRMIEALLQPLHVLLFSQNKAHP